ncbi:MAG: cobamide remodeling phosphodiesterase CbiR [Kiritimatiellae bacterium]|nr:cobamide remodeling phosphodiesterase CbiR [Kiritimatiellia bacterium]
MPELCARRPWRVGATSYVYPADVLPNVELTAPAVDDIEIVLFESDEFTNLPSAETIERLASLGARHATTYTIHFPLDLQFGGADRAARLRGLTCMQRILALTAPLTPYAYILHLDPIRKDATPDEVRRWQQHSDDSLRRLLENGALPPAMLAVENLSYPFDWCDDLIEKHALSVCLDFGHLRLMGVPPATHCARYLGRTRVVHLHGESNGKDHLPLTVEPPARLAETLELLRPFGGVVTLELFDYDAVASSIERLNTWFTTGRT